MSTRRTLLVITLLLLPALVPASGAQTNLGLSEPVEVTALAVALTEQGNVVGSSASISVSVAQNGSGHVFIDTRPLAGTDMQGSARIAARVASSLTGYALEQHDFFFVVRSDSPIIAGPSAGSIMTLATVVALENAHLNASAEPWSISEDVMATGTISPDGSIGPVGGILEKAQAAANRGAELFLVPEGQGTYTPRIPGEGGIQERRPVDVPAFCEEEIGITCQEVGTIDELVQLATGHTFVEPPLGEPPSTAQYTETLGPLSSQLLENASAYQATWDELNASSVSVDARELIGARLEQAHAFAQDASRLHEQTRFYSAASRAFSASIHGEHAKLLLEFFEGGRSLDMVEDRIREATGTVREAERAAGAGNVTGMHTLYTVGAAQSRVSDAENRIDRAWQQFNASNIPASLFDVAWATERAETVHWWLSLGEPFGDGPALPVEVSQLADEFIDLADEMLAYSGSVIQGQQGPPRAVERLELAKSDDQRGFHAAALIEAAEAQVLAALALETQSGTPTEDRINASREDAARAIQQARGRSVEPILPIALFEFAGVQEDNAIALEFYRTSRVLAGFSSVLTGTEEPNPSRFTGAFEPSNGGHTGTIGTDQYQTIAVGWFTIGVFATSALAVLGVALVSGRD